MTSTDIVKLSVSHHTNLEVLKQCTWLVVLHTNRIPPHIGILINGSYYSLTIKGQDLGLDLSVLLKTIKQKNIETIFICLKKHPVFSIDFQKEICKHFISQFEKVKPNYATCLSPVKLFLQEFYAISLIEDELLYQLIERLNNNNYIEFVFSLNLYHQLNNGCFEFVKYSNEQLQQAIIKETQPFN